MSELIEISRLDELRFGFTTAKARAHSPAQVREVLDAGRAQGIQLLILRIPAAASTAVVAAEHAGARLMDTLCYYDIVPTGVVARAHERGVTGASPDKAHFAFRIAAPQDAALVEALARDAFRDYAGHYENDIRLRREDCAEVYPSWARSCCEQSTPALPVFIASAGGEPVGFAATRQAGHGALDVALLGVSSRHRGQGVGSALLHHMLACCGPWGVERLSYSTQITNIPMQRLLASAGFFLTSADYTLHHWNEEGCQ